jgi:hypothetical protein
VGIHYKLDYKREIEVQEVTVPQGKADQSDNFFHSVAIIGERERVHDPLPVMTIQ